MDGRLRVCADELLCFCCRGERFTTGKFTGLRRPTVGADFLSKKLIIHDVEVFLQVWDTAGQERFHQGSIGSSFFRGAHGALLVYDVNDERSIEQIEQWRDECLARQEGGEFFPIVVIGNKIDIRDSKPEEERVDVSSILSWCRENGYGHVETSAKDGNGVEAAMLAITALALESQRGKPRVSTRMQSVDNGQRVRLDSKYTPKDKGCACTS